MREISPALAQDWVDELRQQVDSGDMKPRTFNRRISAVSALYRWASEPTRSSVTGIPRNPIPPRVLLQAPKLAKPLPEADLTSVLGAISQARATGCPTAARDYVLVRGSYLLGCRVSELARLKWGDIEAVEGGGQVHLLGKGNKARTVRISSETLDLLESLGRGEPDAWVFPSNRKDGPLSRQAIAERMRRWGREAEVHLHPHKLRHTHATHAIRRGVDSSRSRQRLDTVAMPLLLGMSRLTQRTQVARTGLTQQQLRLNSSQLYSSGIASNSQLVPPANCSTTF